MKITLLAAGAFAVALAMPLGAYAQQTQPQGAMAQQRTTAASEPAAAWMKRLGKLNLSGDQQQRIQSMIDQYSQAIRKEARAIARRAATCDARS